MFQCDGQQRGYQRALFQCDCLHTWGDAWEGLYLETHSPHPNPNAFLPI